jgi:hypothetical protein
MVHSHFAGSPHLNKDPCDPRNLIRGLAIGAVAGIILWALIFIAFRFAK